MGILDKTSLVLGLTLLFFLVSEARVQGDTEFITTQRSHFVLNGTTFLFNGFNSYWLMYTATEPTERYKVSQLFREASAAGLSVCRTWAFSDGDKYRSLQITPSKYDERTFQGLDFVISEAKKYGIYLILSFVNNWNDYGGKHQCVQWARDAGFNVANDDSFYTHPLLKEYYKSHISRIVTRFNTFTGIVYRDDPTIMAWELMNEPHCDIDKSGRTITAWVKEMASFVKSLDNKHLLEIGFEGYYGDSVPKRKEFNPPYPGGTDYIASNLVENIDFATIHAYPDTWLPGTNDTTQLRFMERWLQSHWKDSRSLLKKPLILSEFGKPIKTPGYNSTTARDDYMNHIYKIIYNYARRSHGTMSGSLVWQIMPEGDKSFMDIYSFDLSESFSTAALMAEHAHLMKVLSSRLDRVHGHGALRPPNRVV